jgi:O-6-methylguanine DNA methyltransferase
MNSTVDDSNWFHIKYILNLHDYQFEVEIEDFYIKKIKLLEEVSDSYEECPQELARSLGQLLAGQYVEQFPRYKLCGGSLFERRVWTAISRIPYGQTKTYGEIAEEVGSPRAYQAVGQACGKNPVPLLIPCHRVVAKNGLGGFIWGQDLKQRLLQKEI